MAASGPLNPAITLTVTVSAVTPGADAVRTTSVPASLEPVAPEAVPSVLVRPPEGAEEPLPDAEPAPVTSAAPPAPVIGDPSGATTPSAPATPPAATAEPLRGSDVEQATRTESAAADAIRTQ